MDFCQKQTREISLLRQENQHLKAAFSRKSNPVSYAEYFSEGINRDNFDNGNDDHMVL